MPYTLKDTINGLKTTPANVTQAYWISALFLTFILGYVAGAIYGLRSILLIGALMAALLITAIHNMNVKANRAKAAEEAAQTIKEMGDDPRRP